MNTESREHLSTLMDGEVNRETGRFLLRRLGSDDGLRQTWARYHLIRDCLRFQDGYLAQQDLSGRIRSALSAEAGLSVGNASGKRWLKPIAGAAVAASVALIAVLTVSSGGQQGVTPAAPALAQAPATESFASPNIGSVMPESQPVNLSGSSGQETSKMNAYLLRHYQVTGDAGGRGFVSFVPIIITQAPAVLVETEEQEQTVKGEDALR